MKLIRLFIAAFVAFALLAACKPSSEQTPGTQEEDPSSEQTPGTQEEDPSSDDKPGTQEEEENYVIYAGTKYEIVHSAGAAMAEVGELGGKKGFRFSFYIGSDGCHCFPRIESALKGQQIDLTKVPDALYSFDINDNNEVINVHQYVDEDYETKQKKLRGNLGGSTQDGAQFKSGTMFVDKQGKDIIFKMDAVTLLDKDLKINLKFEELSER